MKRKGFSGIVDWCLLHQQDKLAGDAELSTADDKVVSWLLSSVSLFTCGQCLVLLGMLCEVFVRRAATDKEFLLEGVENGILRVIAALSQRVENSDNLDKQPLRIVVGAVYGLQRVEQCLMPSARSAMPPSPGLYYTLASVSQQCESAEAGVLLTLLLVLSENAFMDLITEKERVKTTEKTAQMLTELLEKDAEKKGDETLTRQIPLSEVISIMENIRSADVRQRLAIFKYLAFTVKRHYDSAEQPLIKSAVDTLSGIPEEERLPLTSQFVQQYSITSIPVALSLLPYVTDETAFLESGEFLSVKSIESMTAFDASFVLLIVGNRIGIEKLRLLVSTALGGYEPLLKRYTACLSASVAVDGEEGDALSYMEEAEDEEELVKLEEEGASEKKIPMDQTLYNVLHFLMVNAPEGFLDAKGKKTLIAAIVNQIDWLEMSEETAAQQNSSFDVQVTKMLVRVMKQKLLVEELDSATFYEKRIKPLLGQPRMDLTTSPEFIDLLRDCIQQMDSTELRRAILERALYFNGTDTVDSICKFLDSLSDLCVELRFYPRLVLKVLLVTKHIDARATTWVSDDESSAVTHKLLCNGLRYMLSVPEWQIDDQRDDIRTACSNWVEHYFQVLQLQRRQSTEGKEDDRQEVLSNDEMERLLALALQVGCKFTNFTFSEVNRRVHAGLEEPAGCRGWLFRRK
ncbi:hypothetical protein ADEAN_000062600 [Angomonas deanei]|uniref:Uncharacterized protein n=1 Tax=Angomonas deanei TaxID=59799 RepID=A0A7G2C0D1_9TRYP|nr:hypothetical protein ADEAN_000062600 [Angomonas deanei]